MASSMGYRLAGKTILITGASSGIGRSTAKEFARTCPSNLKLILAARRFDSLQTLADEIRSEVGDGVRVFPIKLDVSKFEDTSSFIGKLPDEFKDIDILVNNAYVPCSPGCPLPILLTILFAQRSCQGRSPGSRYCFARYPDHVRDQCCRLDQHDSDSVGHLQRETRRRLRRYYQYWQYCRPRALSRWQYLLRDKVSRTIIHGRLAV
jgi:hypothetical protein